MEENNKKEGKFEMNVIKWVDGKLTNFVTFFKDLEEAIEHALQDIGMIKIYDHNNNHCIVFSHEKHHHDTYA